MLPTFSSFREVIRCRDVQVSYPGVEGVTLEIEHLSIPRGECLVLCGRSGSGKSSVLSLLNGLVPKVYPADCRGDISLLGQSIKDLTLEELSCYVASVFQNPSSQFFHQHVLEELVFPCENQGLSSEEITRRLDEVNALFHLEPLYERKIASLSGGQKQRLALAISMMQGAEIILLDEPTANLDRLGVKMVQSALHLLKEQGKTLIIVEHRLSYLNQLADRYLYFHEGKIQADMTKEEFLGQTDEKRRELGLRSLVPLHFYERIEAFSGNMFTGPIGLSVQNLSVKQGGEELLYFSRLDLPVGQVIGIVGSNGSGKTTFAHHLVGLRHTPVSTLEWKGSPLHDRDRLAMSSMIMQEVRLQLFSETVERELTLGSKDKQLNQELLAQFGLSDLLHRHPMSLSGGEQQRLLLAASLLADKEMLILDEPTSGLDFMQMQAVAEALLQLKKENKFILLISHDEELLEMVCDQVVDIEQLKSR